MSSRDNSPNAILDMLQSQFPEYHPLMALAQIAHAPDPTIEWGVRVQCHKIIADKLIPNLKSVEHKDGKKIPTVHISMFGDNGEAEEIQVIDNREPLPLYTKTVK